MSREVCWSTFLFINSHQNFQIDIVGLVTLVFLIKFRFSPALLLVSFLGVGWLVGDLFLLFPRPRPRHGVVLLCW